MIALGGGGVINTITPALGVKEGDATTREECYRLET
jgi:hypothetical protein